MSIIAKLTDTQIARFPEFIERWTQIGLSTELADRPRAEQAIQECYQLGKLSPPPLIIWCESPLSLALTYAIAQTTREIGGSVWKSVRESVGDNIRASVWESVGESVWKSVRESVGGNIWESVWESVGENVRESVRKSVRESVGGNIWESVWKSVWGSVETSVGGNVRESVRASVWESVGESVWKSVRKSVGGNVWESVWESVGENVRESVRVTVRESVWESVYGAHDASWISFYSYMRDVLGLLKHTKPFSGLAHLALYAGWALPCRRICWVSERHNIIQRDEYGRLHCLTGPACVYPDGWSIYAVHGVRVPRKVVENPTALTLSEINQEKNAEVRRIMIERLGLAQYAGAQGLQPVHIDDSGRLYCTNDREVCFVEVINSTPNPDGSRKHYFLAADPNCRTATQAVADSFGLNETAYRALKTKGMVEV